MNRVKAHRKADLLAAGETGNPAEGQKGCAVACTLNRYDHYAYPVELGVPVPWAQLEDRIFEELHRTGNHKQAQAWPEAFLKAIKPGADLLPALDRFNARVLLEVSLPNCKGEPMPHRAVVEESIKAVAHLLIVSSQGGAPSPLRAYWQAFHDSAARSAADSAAYSAADSAAYSAARSAAYSAARSAAYSAARSAARSAAYSAARSAARSAAYSAAYSAADSAADSAAYSAAWLQMSKIALEELQGVPKDG